MRGVCNRHRRYCYDKCCDVAPYEEQVEAVGTVVSAGDQLSMAIYER